MATKNQGQSPLVGSGGRVMRSGRIETRSASPRTSAPVTLSPESVAQLALQLGAVMRPAPVERPMLGELIDAWLQTIAPTRVRAAKEETWQCRQLLSLWLEDEDTLTAAKVNAVLEGLTAQGYAAQTVNKIRAAGKLAIDHAQSGRRWLGPNPFKLANRVHQPRLKHPVLTFAELAAVQAQLSPERRRLFRASLYLGARPGELFALRARDVDLITGTVQIRRSHKRNTTKTGTERVVPIHPAIDTELRLAVRPLGPDDLVFPKSDGTQQRSDTKLTRELRAAMGRAGVRIDSVELYCRSCFWKATKPLPDELISACPRCAKRLRATPLGARVRWYDLRHMNATAHHEASADPLCVAISLGHAVKNTTQGVYTHVSDDRLKRELSRWFLPGDTGRTENAVHACAENRLPDDFD